MRKKIICVVLIVVSLALCLSAEAQQQKIAKIGWLGARPGSGPASGPEVIRRELSNLGYVEGRTLFSSIVTTRVTSTGFPLWLVSWFGSKSI